MLFIKRCILNTALAEINCGGYLIKCQPKLLQFFLHKVREMKAFSLLFEFTNCELRLGN